MAHPGSARLSPAEGRRFALTLAIAFGALASLAWWRGGAHVPVVLGAVAGMFLLAALLAPGRLGPVYRSWMGLALAISKVTTPVFMGVVYFLVITPVGLIRRMLGGNPLRRTHGTASGWVDRRDTPRGDLTRQF